MYALPLILLNPEHTGQRRDKIFTTKFKNWNIKKRLNQFHFLFTKTKNLAEINQWIFLLQEDGDGKGEGEKKTLFD